MPIISLNNYIDNYKDFKLICACRLDYLVQVKKQLNENQIYDYEVYNDSFSVNQKIRLISYSNEKDMEDVILYHVLKDEPEVRYIDVGSNDPFKASVTKLLYDMLDAHGINIEPMRYMHSRIEKERPRDINLCVGIGENPGKAKLFYQEGLSTIVAENVWEQDCYSEEIEIYTLKQVCDKYCDFPIALLKIDVEGSEKAVLTGADFENYRPAIICMESTLPLTDIPCYSECEEILLNSQYHFVYHYGVNRYYVADERHDLDDKFVGVERLKELYSIYYAEFL